MASTFILAEQVKKINKWPKDHRKKPKSAVFIWHLMCDEIGVEHAYRNDWESVPQFDAAFKSAKDRIGKMEIRYIDEADSVKRALLEIYAAVVSGAKYNDLDEP